MKATCFSAEATRGSGLGSRYSKPSRARSVMQPECEYSRSNSATIWAWISTVDRQKRPSSHVHNAVYCAVSYGADRPSSRQRQALPSHLVGGAYTSHGWCHRPVSPSSNRRIAFARRAMPWSSRWRRTQASSSRRSAEERKPGRIMDIAASFQTQQSSHQLRLPQNSKDI